MVEDRCVHAALLLTSIELSFDPCNVYRDGPRGVGYPADARSVGGSHPSCKITFMYTLVGLWLISGQITSYLFTFMLLHFAAHFVFLSTFLYYTVSCY